MKVNWSRRAISDLERQCDFIARDRPKAADDVEARVFAAAARLADFPEVGAMRPGQDTRGLLVARTGLSVVYRVHRGQVFIVTIRHQMRKPRRA